MAKILSCRSCGNKELKKIISFGDMPLANSLVKAEKINEIEKKFPLELVFCPKCSLIQINETIEPEILFGEYLYYS